MDVSLGCIIDEGLLTGPLERRRLLAQRAVDAGITHAFTADHVSFHTGMGMDGILRAALVSTLHERLGVHVGVYLLALRHPLPVARQIVSLAESAPNRFVLGIGVGGEDPHEFEVCGVNPKTRGARTSEMLQIIKPLLAGETVTHRGTHFQIENAKIRPRLDHSVPIVVGGRSPAALRRAAQYADGYLGIWSDARKYQGLLAQFHEFAAAAGRSHVPFKNGLQLWAAVGSDRAEARARLAARMENMYRIPYERFARFAPAGTVREVADFLAPLREAGCEYFNLLAVADSTEQMIDDTAAVAAELAR